jgi:hypothetical protein
MKNIVIAIVILTSCNSVSPETKKESRPNKSIEEINKEHAEETMKAAKNLLSKMPPEMKCIDNIYFGLSSNDFQVIKEAFYVDGFEIDNEYYKLSTAYYNDSLYEVSINIINDGSGVDNEKDPEVIVGRSLFDLNDGPNFNLREQLTKKYGSALKDGSWRGGINKNTKIEIVKGVDIMKKKYCNLRYTYLPIAKEAKDFFGKRKSEEEIREKL